MRFHRRALALYRQVDDVYGVAQTYDDLGLTWTGLGRWDEAFSCFDRAITALGELGDKYTLAEVYWHVAQARRQRGQREEARSAGEKSLALYRQVGTPESIEVEIWLEALGVAEKTGLR